MAIASKLTSEKPQEIAVKGDSETPVAKETHIKRLVRQILQSRVFWSLLGGATVLLCLLLWTRLQFGWIREARASWNDERLFVEPSVVSVDGLRAKEKNTVQFQVKNLTDKTITLRWSNPSSSYFGKVQLPVDIEPGEKKLIELSLLVPHTGKFSQYMLFYTSDEVRPAFFVRIAGQLVQ